MNSNGLKLKEYADGYYFIDPETKEKKSSLGDIIIYDSSVKAEAIQEDIPNEAIKESLNPKYNHH